ncbi:MAG: CoA pyrophosphatase [Acidiferrobacterales bacterium]
MRTLFTSRLSQSCHDRNQTHPASRAHADENGPQPLIPAAALVPVIDHPGGGTILLTQRTQHLHDHAGQISFPGGRVEPGDESPTATALRETEEEIGLERRFVEIVGYLDPYKTGTGFLVTPVVGLVSIGFSLSPDEFEVADIFEVPLDYVLDASNHRRETRYFDGVKRTFEVIEYENRYIWGATAGMLVDLYRKLHSDD